MKESTFNIATNIMSIIAATIAVSFLYILDMYDHAIFLMGLAIYLKE